MVDRPQIKEQMEVLASDGTFLGRVAAVEAQAIRLAVTDSPGLRDHLIPLDWVARVDRHVHLNIGRDGLAGLQQGRVVSVDDATVSPAAGAVPPVIGAAGAAIGVVGAGAAGHIEQPGAPASAAPISPPPAASGLPRAAAGAAKATGEGDRTTPLPPIRNPAVPGARPRANYYLPWILALLGTLLLLFLLLRSCETSDIDEPAVQRTAPGTAAGTPVSQTDRPVPVVTDLVTGTIAYDLNARLASGAAGERTFAFDRLDFRTGSARIRREDEEDLDAIARVLIAYPTARIAVVGYTDARGGAGTNARLGGDRANAVVGELAERGVPPDRMEARSGGEADPIGANRQEGGRAENRRTELILLSR